MKNGSFFMSINSFIITIFIFCFFICVFFMPVISTYDNLNTTYSNFINSNTSEYIWPLKNNYTITSNFGKRISPTIGASSFHKGIDISAPEGTELLAVCDGIITFTNFLGGGGYTITLSQSDNIRISYCHVSPNYIVTKGATVKQGDIIGHVGPKNVYGVPGNKYYDSYGNPTNGATTGPHLHIGFRVDGNYKNPLDFLNKK